MKINYHHEYLENGIYHIYNRSNNHQDLFLYGSDYDRFLNKYFDYFHHIFDTYAYCLMPNHFHFIVKVKSESNIKSSILRLNDSKATALYMEDEASLHEYISDQFRRWLSSYALYRNRKYKSRGQLFQNRHKSIGIRSEQKLLEFICYVHHNPIHHGFCGDYNQWDYSSYFAYFQNDKTSINTTEILDLSEGKDNLYNLHKEFKFTKLIFED